MEDARIKERVLFGLDAIDNAVDGIPYGRLGQIIGVSGPAVASHTLMTAIQNRRVSEKMNDDVRIVVENENTEEKVRSMMGSDFDGDHIGTLDNITRRQREFSMQSNTPIVNRKQRRQLEKMMRRKRGGRI